MIGKKCWAIAEGFLPPPGPDAEDRALRSHETACILNANDEAAQLRITIYFQDREPAGPYRLTLAGRRTLHLRFDELQEPEPIPRGTDYASLIESSVPVVVQHTRLDAREQPFKIISTLAWAID